MPPVGSDTLLQGPARLAGAMVRQAPRLRDNRSGQPGRARAGWRCGSRSVEMAPKAAAFTDPPSRPLRSPTKPKMGARIASYDVLRSTYNAFIYKCFPRLCRDNSSYLSWRGHTHPENQSSVSMNFDKCAIGTGWPPRATRPELTRRSRGADTRGDSADPDLLYSCGCSLMSTRCRMAGFPATPPSGAHLLPVAQPRKGAATFIKGFQRALPFGGIVKGGALDQSPPCGDP